MVSVGLRKASQSQFSLHDRIIGQLAKPFWLKEGRLIDNQWVIETLDPETNRKTRTQLNFDVPIKGYPDAKSLSDPSFERDLVTLKLVVYYSLSPAPIGWNTQASSVELLLRKHLAFVRWRIGKGVRSNSELNSAWFNEFDRSTKLAGLEGLLELGSKASTFMDAVQAGLVVPVAARRDFVSAHSVAQQLGVTSYGGLTKTGRAVIERRFNEMGRPFTEISAKRETPLVADEDRTKQTKAAYYRPWYDLWHLRKYLAHDPIGYVPFKSPREIAKWVKNSGREMGRTLDAPPYQTSYLINACLSLVLDPLAHRILDVVENDIDERGVLHKSDTFSEVNQRLESLGFPPLEPRYNWPEWRKAQKIDICRFVTMILPHAVKTILATFTARRDDELNNTPVNCVELDRSSNAWFSCLINKNENRVDRVPIPRSVVLAVQLLTRIRSLGEASSKWLFDLRCPISKKVKEFSAAKNMDVFTKFLGVPPVEDGTFWRFKPHQFRKFFGVTYFWRFAYPNLTALTYQYRHFNSDATRDYLKQKASESMRMQDEKRARASKRNDVERLSDFASCAKSFSKWVIDQVRDGIKVGGAFGRRVQAQIETVKEKFFPELEVTAAQNEDTFESVLSPLFEKTVLTPHPEGHSLCGCTNDATDLTVSICLGLKERLTGASPVLADGADFEFADDVGCLVCPHRASLPYFDNYWREQLNAAKSARPSATGEYADVLDRRIKTIQEHA